MPMPMTVMVMSSRTTLLKLHSSLASLCSPPASTTSRFNATLHAPASPCSAGRIRSLTPPTTSSHFAWLHSPASQFRPLCARHALSATASPSSSSSSSTAMYTTVSDLKEDTVDLSDIFLTGGKVTSVAHGVWKKVVRPGDTVIDATCGNGHDTLVLTRLVCGDDAPGYVYAFDVQEDALANSSYLLDQRLDSVQRKRVKLLRLCHSQLEKIVGGAEIRLVTFNLGYLPGGDHTVVTNVDTTIQALQAAFNVLQSGGLISVVAYVGHLGGREEFDAVMNFAANLPSNAWVCSQHEWANRPLSPRLILMLKR